jgi:hypothetical protein
MEGYSEYALSSSINLTSSSQVTPPSTDFKGSKINLVSWEDINYNSSNMVERGKEQGIRGVPYSAKNLVPPERR